MRLLSTKNKEHRKILNCPKANKHLSLSPFLLVLIKTSLLNMAVELLGFVQLIEVTDMVWNGWNSRKKYDFLCHFIKSGAKQRTLTWLSLRGALLLNIVFGCCCQAQLQLQLQLQLKLRLVLILFYPTSHLPTRTNS